MSLGDRASSIENSNNPTQMAGAVDIPDKTATAICVVNTNVE